MAASVEERWGGASGFYKSSVPCRRRVASPQKSNDVWSPRPNLPENVPSGGRCTIRKLRHLAARLPQIVASISPQSWPTSCREVAAPSGSPAGLDLVGNEEDENELRRGRHGGGGGRRRSRLR
ncbi:hypothetical protein E2562_026691 [Oryza meyeriana var. granulata]|uniref:Uncharacterized protein n=1 Tax=Oryza meyeriana var. granulata TaxID=110450 RepID=A0A6G1E2R5_9ORYZ|nr:hypothetical protein E2562_026691 [Oryza meyeriana var. granulata]